MKKAIFIDVDGVLNNNTDIQTYGSKFISTPKARLFALLVLATDADIVVSSSWRQSQDYYTLLKSVFAEHMILHKHVGETPDLSYIGTSFDYDRCCEIRAYLNDNPYDRYAIIDDLQTAADDDMKSNLFLTDDKIGLTKDICDAVIKHLNGVLDNVNSR